MAGQRSKIGFNCRTLFNVTLLACAAVASAILYEHLTGNEVPFIGGYLPNATTVRDKAGEIGDIIGDIIDDLPIPDFDYEDIFSFDGGDNGNGRGNETLMGWKFSGTNGLTLEIQNALTEDWHIYFNKAIIDWQLGNPNELTLITSVIAPDPKCTPKDGVMTVCNADFGATGWVGINEVYFQGKYIVSSVAKMNEYYTADTVVNQMKNPTVKIEDTRQYTMCHEIGHGFGLSHLDEDFNNEDRHSCMDYSNSPKNNLNPSEEDYSALFKIYGDGGSYGNATRYRHLRSTMNYNLNGKRVEKRVYILPTSNK